MPRPSESTFTRVALLPMAIAAVGVILSLGLFLSAQRYVRHAQEEDFQADADELQETLDMGIERNLLAVRHLAAFFDASSNVSRNDFAVFSRRVVADYSGIQALEWVPLVLDPDRSVFESNARRDRLPQFSIKEAGTSGLASASSRPEYFPVFYIEPLQANAPVLGYDLGSEPARRAALQKARESGQMTATAPLVLLQQHGRQPGFLVFHPVYQDSSRLQTASSRGPLRGYAVGVYLVNDLVKTSLHALHADGLRLRIADLESAAGAAGLYDSAPAVESANGRFQLDRTLDIGGRKWRLTVTALPSYVAAGKSWAPELILLASLLFTGAIASNMLLVLRRAFHVQRLVTKRTAQLDEVNRQLLSEVQQRKQAQTLYSSLVENIPAAIFRKDKEGRFVFVNSRFCQFRGMIEREILGKTPEELVALAEARGRKGVTPLEMAPLLVQGAKHHEQILRTGEVVEVEEEWHSADGSKRFLQVVKSPVLGLDGSIIGSQGVQFDVTARKEIERALRESEAHLSAIFNSSPAAISLSSLPDGRFIDANESFLSMFGYSRSEVIDHTTLELGLWADLKERERLMNLLLKDKQARNVEAKFRRKSGEIGDALMSGLLMRRGGQPMALGILLDVTERTRLEEQLRHGLKMEGIGQLAGGMAHEFNNILAAIVMSLSLARMSPRNEADELLQKVDTLCARASGLIRQLLAFSRQSIVRKRPLDLAAYAASEDRILRAMLGSRVALDISAHPGLPLVNADPVLMDQVFLNLCLNARDAMNGVGTLRIGVEEVSVSIDQAQLNKEARSGRFIRLSVADTGCGMDEPTLKKIFEPFFTTKGVGQGTGLGLATVRGIVQQHEGWIEVESVAGQGATFRIYLPVFTQDPPLGPP